VFLNHGSFGACPLKIQKLQTELREQMEAEPVQFLWRRYEERLDPARRKVAEFVGARAKDLVFVTNATAGVNAVMRSLKLKRGDEILTTNHDYNACRNVLVEAARESRAKLVSAQVPFPLNSETQIVEAVLAKVTRRTRFAMLDHVTSNTALVFPVARIIRELASRGIETLVDGAHAPGMVELNVSKLGCTYYTANLHKWVCAPKGTAFLWAREDRQKDLQPGIISHGNNTHRPGWSHFQDRFDWAGTFDPTGWFCAGEAMDWMQARFPGGWPAIRKANHALVVRARRLLSERLALEPTCPESMLGCMATLPLLERFQGRPKRGKIDGEQLRLYDEFCIEVPFVRIGEPSRRYFRISAQLYNTLAEYEYLAAALKAL
jgi:isopenicillin-N epimerase